MTFEDVWHNADMVSPTCKIHMHLLDCLTGCGHVITC